MTAPTLLLVGEAARYTAEVRASAGPGAKVLVSGAEVLPADIVVFAADDAHAPILAALPAQTLVVLMGSQAGRVAAREPRVDATWSAPPTPPEIRGALSLARRRAWPRDTPPSGPASAVLHSLERRAAELRHVLSMEQEALRTAPLPETIDVDHACVVLSTRAGLLAAARHEQMRCQREGREMAVVCAPRAAEGEVRRLLAPSDAMYVEGGRLVAVMRAQARQVAPLGGLAGAEVARFPGCDDVVGWIEKRLEPR